MAAGGSAALHSERGQSTVVFITEDRTGVAFKAALAETAEGNSGVVQRREVNFDLEEDETESMENRAVFLSFRMRLYNRRGELYANHNGEAFEVLRKALRRFAELSEKQAGLTVFKMVMMELKRCAPRAPLRMSALVHVAEKGKLMMQFTLSDGSGGNKNFKLEYGLMEIDINVYRIDAESNCHGDGDGGDDIGYVSAYSGGYIADRHRGSALGMGHDLALQESINKEMIRWWPRTDINRVMASTKDGCLWAWSVQRYMECTMKLFAGHLQHQGAGEGGTEVEPPFPLVVEEDGSAGGGEVVRGEHALERDQSMVQVEVGDLTLNPSMPLVVARPVLSSGGATSALEQDEHGLPAGGELDTEEKLGGDTASKGSGSLAEVYKGVMDKAQARLEKAQMSPHKNQLGMFTLHVCEVSEQMTSNLPSEDEGKWQEKKDFVARLQRYMDITGTSAVVQRRDREVGGKKVKFTLVKMKVTAAPTQAAINYLQKRQLQLLLRRTGEEIEWRGRRLRVYVWLGTQSPTDTAIFEIRSDQKTFAQMAQQMLDRDICSWIFRGRFQIDPLKSVMSKQRVVGAMSVMVLCAEDYGRMAKWEVEDQTVRIKLSSNRKSYQVQRQGDDYQWVCPQDEVTIERDTYYIKVTPLNPGMKVERMVEMQKRMKLYSSGQGQLSNISLGQDARRKHYARYVGRGPDIVSVVDFYGDMAGINGYPNSPRVEIVAVNRWDSQFKLDSDICSKCCEVGHSDVNCIQVMVCSECFKLGDGGRLACVGQNCRWPNRGSVEERRRYETLDSNALRRTALRYIGERAGLVKGGEVGGGSVVRMPSSVAVTAQVGREEKRRVVAGPTRRETYEDVERIFAVSDQAETAKAVSREYYREVIKGTTGTRLFNETTSSLKTQVIKGEMSPAAAGKVQQGAKRILADVIASGRVKDQTWLSTLEDMCDTTNFHALAGTPQKIDELQTGLTPAVGDINLASQAKGRGQMVLRKQGAKPARRRLRAELGKSSGSDSDGSSSSMSSSSSSESDSSSEDQSDGSDGVTGERGAGRKSKRKKRSKKKRRKKKEKRRRARKKRKLARRRRREKRERQRSRREERGRGGAPSGAAPSKADPLGASMGT